ncbi:MAG: DNA polymerase Y family protein, partial [Gammaproteobacteria bacterium]|nr:DNA polymerase Y family protein [Gammaproteobacteria bacterium]
VMKSRACKPPVLVRGAAPTPPAVQQDLPFPQAEPSARAGEQRSYRRAPAATPVERLWFCIWLPHLPLEANRSSEAATAIVEEQHGIHRILLADAEATAAGVMSGQAANAALALLPTLLLEERSLLGEQQALEGLATWLERFSSFVCIADRDVLLLEIAGSLRLFGGLQELRKKIARGVRELGFTASLSIAPTPLAATWLARSGRRACIRDEANLAPALRRLPLACLHWPAGLCEALAGMGVTTVGDCLRLPREGFTRRFGTEYLLALDRALGHLPDPRDSWRAPERFCADYEMTEEQSNRELLLNICRELLLSHEQFLLARQLGTQRVCFSFFHLKAPATELRLGCARAERSAERWLELLGIRFEQLILPEAVIAVRLRSGIAQPLQAKTDSLNFHGKPAAQQRRFSITQLAERLIARIGAQSVQATSMVAEHRPHYAWRSQSLLADWSGTSLDTPAQYVQRPLWMLPEPALLPSDSGYPVHQGCRLRLINGPERLETGWWDEDGISRDYYTAINADGRHLWVFRNRNRASSWYLHGYFG